MIILALVCCVTSSVTSLTSCQLFKVVPEDREAESSLTNFSKAVDNFFDDFGFGVSSIDSGNRSRFFYEEWEKYDAVTFGAMGYQPIGNAVPESERGKCIPFLNYADEIFLTEEEATYYYIMYIFAYLTVPFAAIGILCAMVELCFCVFYPSVIAGAIFLSTAACTESVSLLMYVIDHRSCFAGERCFVSRDFWVFLFVIGGFFFSSNLLIFGLRTYPWCCRKNRDPDHCKVVEAEVLSEEEIYQQEQKWDARRNKDPESYINDDYFDESAHSETSYTTLKHQLQDAQRKLAQSDKDYAIAIARAERAEAMLKVFEQRKRESTVVKFEEPKIQKDTASVVTNEDDYIDAVAYTGEDEP